MTEIDTPGGEPHPRTPPPAAVLAAQPKFLPRPREPIGRPRLHRPSRRTNRLLIVLGVLLVIYLAFAAKAALHAKQQLSDGRALLNQAKVMTSDNDLRTARASGPLLAGSAKLDSARGDLESLILKPLQFLPVLGRQMRSASALALAGSRSANAVADALTGVRDLTRTAPGVGGRVALLQKFRTIVTTASVRVDSLNLGPSHGLLPVLANTRNDLATELYRAASALSRSVGASNAALDLLSGHHSVLLLLTNNAEMRAGSGMPNVLGVLNFDDGRAVVEPTQRVADVPVPAGAVPATGDFGARWGWLQPTVDWQELLASPRFDATAPLAARMWAASGHAPVDAVMAVDPFALQAIIGATGPVQFGTRQITTANVIPELLHDQYEQFPDQLNAARHEELGALTQATISSLDAGGWSAATLGLNLATTVRGRHMMVWASSAADEQAWTNVGAGGTVGPSSLVVSVLNRSRDKGDYFLYTNAAIQPHPTPTGTDVTVTMALDNRAPATDLPYVIGPGIGVQDVVRPGETVAAGDYVGLVAVTLPQSATGVRIVDDPNPVVFGPDGRSVVIGEQYLIKRGTTQLVTLQFHLPPAIRSLRLEPAARAPSLYWRYPSGVFIPSDAAHQFSW